MRFSHKVVFAINMVVFAIFALVGFLFLVGCLFNVAALSWTSPALFILLITILLGLLAEAVFDFI